MPRSTTLPELHDVLQAALGWTNSHLHQFVAGELRYGVPDLDDLAEQLDEGGARLTDLPTRFTYLYDFGDGWEHDVEVLGPGAEDPGLRYGEGACPPEDCGGPHGYSNLLHVLADPSHEEYAEMRQWAGELANFDEKVTDQLVRQTVGEVPGSVRLVLGLAQGGVRLTPGGRLPRAFVRQVQEHRPQWHPFGDRPASIEEDLFPLLTLHDLLRQAGLLRLRHGVLSPTKAASDDLEVVRRIRSRFPPESFSTILAGVAIAVLAATGPQRPGELAAKVHPMLGHSWALDGRALTVQDVRSSIGQLSPVLRGLDQIDAELSMWRAGPSARSLLPRATALSALWSKNQGVT